MEYADYYKLMGLTRDATADDIKRAYRKLARKYHPDVSKEADAESRFKALGEAYQVLKDPEKRAAYDQLGSNWQSGQPFNPPPGWQQPRSTDEYDQPGQADFSEFFEQMFGSGRHGRGQRPRPQSGADTHATISVTLEEACAGSSRTIKLSHPVLNQQGQVEQRERSLAVKIPAGVYSGQQIRLAGQGSPGPGGAGNLYLEVMIAPRGRYHVEGKDVFMTLPLAPWDAALGTSITVAAPTKKIALTIPSNSAAGDRLRLKGLGIPSSPPGDFFVDIEIVLPAADTAAAKKAYEQFQQAFSTAPSQPSEPTDEPTNANAL